MNLKMNNWLNLVRKKSGSGTEVDLKALIHGVIENVLPKFREAFLVAQLSRPDGSAVNELREHIARSEFQSLMEIDNIEVKLDVVQLYLVLDSRGVMNAVIIVDPFDLYADPYVADVVADLEVDDEILSELRYRQHDDRAA